MTVKEGQQWVSDYVKNRALENGLEVRTFWRAPENGVDWKFEIHSEEAEASVFAIIWFLHLKQLDPQNSGIVTDKVDKALERLLNKAKQVA